MAHNVGIIHVHFLFLFFFFVYSVLRLLSPGTVVTAVRFGCIILFVLEQTKRVETDGKKREKTHSGQRPCRYAISARARRRVPETRLANAVAVRKRFETNCFENITKTLFSYQ